MLRQISTHPRLVANNAGATSTDTVHRVRVVKGVSMAALAAVSFNSITFAMAEIVGRSYGGGILELEPSEAEELVVPDPALATSELIQKADELAKDKRIEDALDLVDRTILVDALGFSEREIANARAAWHTLSARRAGRGKK
jgi:adenine-specific DNA methylase